MLDEAENQLQLDNGGGAWMNPEAPLTDKSENYGTECDVNNCPFFLKTGACRFGDRCSRKHFYPTSSPTLMIRGMFRTFGMEEARRDDYDIDACLEHSEEELHESFVEFYHDVLPEFRSVGKVVQFKISCNYEPHLRGNVYIQFDTEEQCKEAFIKFNGRWYAGRQLHCEMCPVTRWKNAICGLFDRQKCPKGKHCNFLHVFRNPGNEFWEADRDWHLSPNCGVRGSRRDGWYSERYRERSWRSGSPPRSERTHNRRRSRSRSRERRDKEDKWTPGWRRHGDRRKDVSRGRDRSRSRSRDRDRDRENNKYRRRSEERDGRDKDGETRGRSRSTSAERRRKRRSNRDSKERSKKTQSDDGNAHRRHKHSSKKNKKKSKKKHKKKRHVTEGTTSSDESEKEEEKTEEEETENCSAATETILKTSDVDQSVDSETKSSSPQGQSERSNTETPTGRMDAPT